MRVAVFVWCAGAGLALLAGCGGGTTDPAEAALLTHPVKGKLVFTKGGNVKSLFDRQALIALDSVSEPGTRATGEIQEDGTFTVATSRGGANRPGAIAGRHRVRLNLDEGAARLVAPQFTSFDRSGITVEVPHEGELTVSVWK